MRRKAPGVQIPLSPPRKTSAGRLTRRGPCCGYPFCMWRSTQEAVRGSPAKGVGWGNWREGSNPSFSANTKATRMGGFRVEMKEGGIRRERPRRSAAISIRWIGISAPGWRRSLLFSLVSLLAAVGLIRVLHLDQFLLQCRDKVYFSKGSSTFEPQTLHDLLCG